MARAHAFHYCPNCSAPLTSATIEEKLRKKCTSCNFIHWGEYSVGVGGVLIHEEKALFVQRAKNPSKGRWTIPGGFVDVDEKMEDAIVREFWEETGLKVAPVSIIAVRDRPVDEVYGKHDLYVVFLLRYLEGTLKPDPEEVADVGYFTPEETMLFEDVAPLSLHLVKQGLACAKQGEGHPGFVQQKGIYLVGTHAELYSI